MDIAAGLDEVQSFVNSSDCSGVLSSVWANMSVPADKQQQILRDFFRSRVMETIKDFVEIECSKEISRSASVERLFSDCYALSKRLGEPVGNANILKVMAAVDVGSVTTTQAPTSPEKKLHRTEAAVADNSSADDLEFSTIRMPVFSAALRHRNGAPDQDTTLEFMSFPLEVQLSEIKSEHNRLKLIASDRLRHLRMIERQRSITELPVSKQAEERALAAEEAFSSEVSRSNNGSSRHQSARSSSATTSASTQRNIKRARSVEPVQSPTTSDHPSASTNVDRLGFRQDLSEDRIHREANCLFQYLKQLNHSMFREIEEEMALMVALSSPDDDFDAFSREVREAVSLCKSSDGIDGSYAQTSVLFHDTPKYISQLFALKTPSTILTKVSSRLSHYQSLLYDEQLLKFAEKEEQVTAAFSKFFSITGDQKYAKAPRYGDMLKETSSAQKSKAVPAQPTEETDNAAVATFDSSIDHVSVSQRPSVYVANFLSSTCFPQLGGGNSGKDAHHVAGSNLFGSCQSTFNTINLGASVIPCCEAEEKDAEMVAKAATDGAALADRLSECSLSLRSSSGLPVAIALHNTRSAYDLKMAKVQRAIACYEADLTQIALQLNIMTNLCRLIEERDSILVAKQNMAARSKEMLMSRSAHMAAALKLDNEVRKKATHRIPQIINEIVPLCESWEAAVGKRATLNNKDILSTIMTTEEPIMPGTVPIVSMSTNGKAPAGKASQARSGAVSPRLAPSVSNISRSQTPVPNAVTKQIPSRSASGAPTPRSKVAVSPQRGPQSVSITTARSAHASVSTRSHARTPPPHAQSEHAMDMRSPPTLAVSRAFLHQQASVGTHAPDTMPAPSPCARRPPTISPKLFPNDSNAVMANRQPSRTGRTPTTSPQPRSVALAPRGVNTTTSAPKSNLKASSARPQPRSRPMSPSTAVRTATSVQGLSPQPQKPAQIQNSE